MLRNYIDPGGNATMGYQYISYHQNLSIGAGPVNTGRDPTFGDGGSSG